MYLALPSSSLDVALMLYTLTLVMCFAFISNVYGEFMQVNYCYTSLASVTYTWYLIYLFIFLLKSSSCFFRLLEQVSEYLSSWTE